MRTITASAALLVALWTSGSHAALKFDLTRTNVATSLEQRHILSRQTGQLELLNNFGAYAVKVSIGTPPQDAYLVVDTGSSDTWVTDSESVRCSQQELGWASRYHYGPCASLFDFSKSRTAKVAFPGALNASYLGGLTAPGDFISETFRMGNAVIEGQILGLVFQDQRSNGILGLGYTVLVHPNSGKTPYSYPTVLDQMFDKGFINLKAYSVFLDSKDRRAGSIIFGGMDTNKYTGDLFQLPIAPRVSPNGTAVRDSLAVYLNSVSITNGTTEETLTPAGMHEHVTLDTGSTLTYIPNEAAQKLYKALGARDDTKQNNGPSASDNVLVDCSVGNTPTTLNYGFGDENTKAEIRVPITAVLFTAADLLGENHSYSANTCILGIKPSIKGMSILGDTFLASAYVVYDLSNNVIALAQMNPNSTTENIIDFKESDTILPGVTATVSLAQVARTTTFYGNLDNISSGTRVRVLTPATANASVTRTSSFRQTSASIPASTSTSTTRSDASGRPIGSSHVMISLFISVFVGLMVGNSWLFLE